MRFETSFEIHDDGTVDLTIEAAFNLDVLEQFGESLGQPLGDLEDMTADELFSEFGDTNDPCGDITESLADFAVVEEPISGDGEIGVRCTVLGIPLTELSDLGDDSALSITQASDETNFELQLSGVSEVFGGGDAIPIPGFEIEELLQFDVSATAPGSIAEHNATSTDGARATWVLTPDAEFVANDSATMTARWEPGSNSSGGWVVPLVIALAAIAVMAILIAVLRGRKNDDDNGVSSIAPPPPPDGLGAPPAAPPVAPPPPPPPSPEGGGNLPPPPTV